MVEIGTIPASNQTLPTSEILEVTCAHFGHLILTTSIWGRCGLLPSNSRHPVTAFSLSSSLDPMTSKCPHFEHSQMGNASPQYLFLEMSQSCMFLSQSNSLSRPNFGIHLIFLAT